MFQSPTRKAKHDVAVNWGRATHHIFVSPSMFDEDHKKLGRLAICVLIDVLNCLIETLI